MSGVYFQLTAATVRQYRSRPGAMAGARAYCVCAAFVLLLLLLR